MTQAAALFLALVMAAQLKAPPVLPADHGAVMASTTKGIVRWSANWTMEPSSVDGKKAVRFTEKGKGQFSPFTQEVQWSMECIWLADGKFFPIHFEKTIRDGHGEVLAVETKVFDRDTGKVTFERRDEKGVTEKSAFSAPADALAIEGIAGILQNFPFGKPGSAASVSGHLLSNEPKLYEVTIEDRGTEMLKTESGPVNCYKLELVPHLGLLNVFKVFYPKSYFWFRAAAPHAWVRYQGLENGPGTPEIVIESR
jgi:hypothetical protein